MDPTLISCGGAIVDFIETLDNKGRLLRDDDRYVFDNEDSVSVALWSDG